MNMEATVGDVGIANDLEIELVSKHMNLKMRMTIPFPIHYNY